MKKLAVLGNGRVAQHYERILSTYFTDSEYAVTDVIDNNPDKLANIVYPQCSKHTSLSKFLNSKSGKLVHYVLVCTPSFLHFEHTKQLLEANIIPIVEKPPVLRVSEIEKLEEIEKKTGKNESQVIKIMRRNLKPSSFRLWRKRVHKTSIKHRKKFKLERKKMREKVRISDIY